MRAKEEFIAMGGETLELVPSLNSSEPWVEALTTMVQRSAGTSLAADSLSLRIVH